MFPIRQALVAFALAMLPALAAHARGTPEGTMAGRRGSRLAWDWAPIG